MLHNRMHTNYGRRNMDIYHHHHNTTDGSASEGRGEHQHSPSGGEEASSGWSLNGREDAGSLSPCSADAGGGRGHHRGENPHDGSSDYKTQQCMPQCVGTSLPSSTLSVKRDISGDWTADTIATTTEGREGDHRVGGEREANGDDDIICDACPGCEDVCSAADTTCITCRLKLESVNSRGSDGHTPTQRGFSIKGFALRSGAPLQEFTTCQVQRHNRVNDCWICAHGKVYDVSEFMFEHAAGIRPLMQRAGGVKDASIDYDFHSSKSRHNEWRRLCIGRVVPCPLRGDPFGVTKTSSSDGGRCGIM